MQKIVALNPETTTGKSKDLFNAVQSKLGMVPNMMRTMGNSPAVLNGYLSFSGALSESSIGAKLGELIALTVANANACDYCNAAHSFIGEKLVGIDPTVLKLAKEGKSTDSKIQAALTFSRTLIAKKGNCSKEQVELTAQNNIRLSMTENSDPYENAWAERMNRTIKEEFGMNGKLKDKEQYYMSY